MKSHRVEVYRSEDNDFRWRRKAGNGEIVSESGEGYENHEHALEMAQDMNKGVLVIDLTLVEPDS